MLRIENLRFSYDGGKEVLRGLSLELEGGLVGCVLGPNGAGKSTLLKVIAGVLEGSEGSVYVDRQDISELTLRERSRLVSYVPQEFSLNFPYTCLEVVLMGRNPHVNPLIGPSGSDVEMARKSLDLVGMGDFLEVPFVHLSGGQKRLVLIARGMAQDGEIMLLDEPTAFLDFKNAVITMSTIESMVRRLKKTALVSLHDPNTALMFCDVVFLMKDGVIIRSGKASEIINPRNLEAVYGMETLEITYNGSKVIVPKLSEGDVQ